MTSRSTHQGGHPRKRPDILRLEKDGVPGIIVLPQVDVARMRLHRDVAGLCRTLEQADRYTAMYAAEFLADIGGPVASDALLRCLDDPPDHPLLLGTVARCLGQLKERRAVSILSNALRRDSWGGDDAIRALGEIGDPEAVGPLLTMLDIPHTFSRWPALAALERIGDPAVVPSLLAALWGLVFNHAGTAAVRALGTLASPLAVPALAFLVGQSQFSSALRRAAAEALRQIDVTVVTGHGRLDPAEPALGDPDPQITTALAEVFSRIPGGVHTLRRSLTNDNPIVRRTACIGLGIREDADDVRSLRTRLVIDPDPTTRQAAATALARIGGDDAAAALIEALDDVEIQDDLAHALAHMEHPPTARLSDLLTRGTHHQQRVAAVALGLLGEQRAAPLLVDLLTATIALPVLVAAVDALGRLRHARAATRLIALLTDHKTPGRLRARAAWALGQVANPAATPALLQALHDPIESVRLRAAEALGALPGSPTTASSLARAVIDDLPDVQTAALRALGNLGREAHPELLRLLSITEHHLRDHVVSVLSIHADVTDLETLTTIAVNDDSPAASHALNGIVELRDPRAVEPLRRVIERQDKRGSDLVYQLRTAALRGLSLIDDPSADSAVMTYYMTEYAAHIHGAARTAVNTVADRTSSG